MLIQNLVMKTQKVKSILFLNSGLKHQPGQIITQLNLQIMHLKLSFRDPGTSFSMKMLMLLFLLLMVDYDLLIIRL